VYTCVFNTFTKIIDSSYFHTSVHSFTCVCMWVLVCAKLHVRNSAIGFTALCVHTQAYSTKQMYVYCINTYIYIHISHIHIQTFTYTYIYINIHLHIVDDMDISVYMYTYIVPDCRHACAARPQTECVHLHEHTHIHHICMQTNTQFKFTKMYIFTYIYPYTYINIIPGRPHTCAGRLQREYTRNQSPPH